MCFKLVTNALKMFVQTSATQAQLLTSENESYHAAEIQMYLQGVNAQWRLLLQ